STEDLLDLVGRELDGRYRLDKYIDRGGFGAVYRGIDLKFNQPVAVKVGLSYREFMKEAKLAAEVRHDHIVQVTDYGNDKGLAYLIMEFLQGEDLEALYKRQGHQLTSEQLRKLVSEVGDALAHAHADNLIHRDLKPRNIILRQSPMKQGGTHPGLTSRSEKFVLLDFGIASKLDAAGTQRNRTQDGAGTVEYMAPELLRANPQSTQQSDIYAFGIILYQMMVGRVPFPQSDSSHMALAECLNSIATLPPPRFAELAPDRRYSIELEEIVLKCLEKDPARRPQSMSEVREIFLARSSPEVPRRPKTGRIDPTQTMRPGEIQDTDTNANSLFDTDVAPDRNQRQAQSSSLPWIVISLFFGIATLSGVFVVTQRSHSSMKTTGVLSRMVNGSVETVEDGSTVQIAAGGSETLMFTLEGVASDVAPEFELPTMPPGINLEAKDGSPPGRAKNLTISVPDLNSGSQKLDPIVFRATVPGNKVAIEKNVTIEIVRPKEWISSVASLLEVGFRPATDSRLCRDENGVVFSSVLERVVQGKSIRFRFVPSTRIGNQDLPPFYMMEKPVTGFLFQEFAKTQSFQPVIERQSEMQSWINGDDQPVTDVAVLEAQQFARWLAPQRGSLPTTTEWDHASGYYLFLQALESKLGKRDSSDAKKLRRHQLDQPTSELS
ncbi:MAG: hypothetical protein FJ267_07240, partial [Planctomycetes bacterium]|nr:hypothetical protein [Planctomycetota bacterium]